jgi:hypothetical protein
LNNDREFAWLLQGLRDPVTHVAFDPVIDEGAVETRWSVPVRELVDDHLRGDFSPWNYPSFVVARPRGFASIEGQIGDGQSQKAVAVFTSREKAESYLKDTAEDGTVCELVNMEEARHFLERLEVQVAAVAIDPTVEDNRLAAKYCFRIATLLDKYLVRDTAGSDSDARRKAPGGDQDESE